MNAFCSAQSHDLSRSPQFVAERRLTFNELDSVIWDFQKSSVRVEAFDNYAAPSDDVMYAAFLAGKAPPAPDKGWVDYYTQLKNMVDSGKEFVRIHTVPKILTPYLRYEIEWAYSMYNVPSGERVLITTRSSNPEVARIPLQDFYLLDQRRVVRLNFDNQMNFQGADLTSDPRVVDWYLLATQKMMTNAVDLEAFLQRLRNTPINVP